MLKRFRTLGRWTRSNSVWKDDMCPVCNYVDPNKILARKERMHMIREIVDLKSQLVHNRVMISSLKEATEELRKENKSLYDCLRQFAKMVFNILFTTLLILFLIGGFFVLLDIKRKIVD